MRNKLRELRIQKNIPAKDMVSVVKKIYPKYDKTTQSKCENPEYGICIQPDAMQALIDLYAPNEKISIRKKENRKLQCRVYGRLKIEEFELLQQVSSRDGYASIQDVIRDLILKYITEKGDQKVVCGADIVRKE